MLPVNMKMLSADPSAYKWPPAAAELVDELLFAPITSGRAEPLQRWTEVRRSISGDVRYAAEIKLIGDRDAERMRLLRQAGVAETLRADKNDRPVIPRFTLDSCMPPLSVGQEPSRSTPATYINSSCRRLSMRALVHSEPPHR